MVIRVSPSLGIGMCQNPAQSLVHPGAWCTQEPGTVCLGLYSQYSD